MSPDPFELTPSLQPIPQALTTAAWAVISRVLGVAELRRLYAAAGKLPSGTFAERALQVLRIGIDVDEHALACVPSRGPLLVVANHPHGAVDGLALAAAIGRVRSDVRLLANHLLARIPEMQEAAFFVDPFGGPASASRSQAGLRAAHLWLRRGGALVVFPAGEVAPRVRNENPLDSDWAPTIGRLALQTGARVLPAWIAGRNSRAFYLAGRIHPRLRTVLLGRELLRARGSRVGVELGRALGAQAFPGRSADEVISQARTAVDGLSERGRWARTEAGEGLTVEVATLGASACLVSSGPYQVYCADASEIPLTLQEIGRLRAETYRAAGEGTSAAVDIDRFDRHYLHLFVWDAEHHAVVGAYRLGLCDRIVADRGIDGLYTRTLFEYGAGLLDRMPPAIELGRSFVRIEYQRQHQPLMLLWKGIGQFVARHPNYRMLFGPVSVSARYSDTSRAALISFLQRTRLDPSLAALVTPKRPCLAACVRTSGTVAVELDALERHVAATEPDAKGLPVLLRQYLRLNARVLGFSVDPAFGDVLDALMAVDLAHVEPSVLTRYLGRDNATAYLARHRNGVDRDCGDSVGRASSPGLAAVWLTSGTPVAS
jgi:putative hemolysin